MIIEFSNNVVNTTLSIYMNNINTEIQRTAYYMTKVVYPQIKKLKWFKDSELYNIENSQDSTLSILDTKCSIDGYILKPDIGSIPIATRCQYGSSYSTFTIRRSLKYNGRTEYDKIAYAIEHPLYTRPQLSIHAYLTSKDNGKLISVAIAKTEDIFSLINKDDWLPAPYGNTFYFVKWDVLKKAGKKITVIEKASIKKSSRSK